MKEGEDGIERSMSAVVVSRYDKGVSEAASRTEGVGVGGHVQRRARWRTGRCCSCRLLGSGGRTIVGGRLEECRSRGRRSGCSSGELN